jgi:RNA polymerase sigma factor for flagellar operon FliA
MSAETHILLQEFTTTRSTETKRKLVVCYLDLVRYVVSKFNMHHHGRSHGLEYDDILHFGVLGLLSALDRYTPVHGVKFETYAVPRIRGAILDEMRKLDWVPRSVRETTRKVGRALHQVMQEQGREPLEAEVAAKLGVSLDEYRALVSDTTMHAGREGSDSRQREYAVSPEDAASDAPTPLERLSDEESRALLREAVEHLQERERTIIALYYFEGLKFTEIAAVLGLTEGRVSQIHSSVLGRLRHILSELEA